MPLFNPCSPCCHDPDKCCITCCPSPLPTEVCLHLTSDLLQEIKIQLVYFDTYEFNGSPIHDVYVGYEYWCHNFTTFILYVGCNGSVLNGVISINQDPYDYPIPSLGGLTTVSGSLAFEISCSLIGTAEFNLGTAPNNYYINYSLTSDEDCSELGSTIDNCFAECLSGATTGTVEFIVYYQTEVIEGEPTTYGPYTLTGSLDPMFGEGMILADCLGSSAVFYTDGGESFGIPNMFSFTCYNKTTSYDLSFPGVIGDPTFLYTIIYNNSTISFTEGDGVVNFTGTVDIRTEPSFLSPYKITTGTFSGSITCRTL